MGGSTRTDARFALFCPVARKPSAARPAARIRRAGEVVNRGVPQVEEVLGGARRARPLVDRDHGHDVLGTRLHGHQGYLCRGMHDCVGRVGKRRYHEHAANLYREHRALDGA